MGIKTNEFPPRFCPLSLTPNITMKNSNESARLRPLYLKLSLASHLRIADASPEQEGIAVRGHSDLLKWLQGEVRFRSAWSTNGIFSENSSS